MTSQLAKVLAKNIGKKATINKVIIQNSNGISKSEDTILPVNWTISTSGPAPAEIKTAKYAAPDYGNFINFVGLSKKSYIAKYQTYNDPDVKIISPKNNYILAPIPQQKGNADIVRIMGESTNIALFTGEKANSGKDTYSFLISPFSKINFVDDSDEYPAEASLSTESKKTYLNFMLNKPEDPSVLRGSVTEIMIKYHKKGDPSDELGLLFADSVLIDKSSGKGKIDLTLSLTDLVNSKGAISIDNLYVYFYSALNNVNKIPSLKFKVVPCDFTPVAAASVKLGKDNVAYITADSLQTTGTTPITAPFQILNDMNNFSSFQISPASKNQWGPNLVKEQFTINDTLNVQIKFDPGSPRVDIKAIVDLGDPATNPVNIIKGVNLSGITKAGGKIQLESFGSDYVPLLPTILNLYHSKPELVEQIQLI